MSSLPALNSSLQGIQQGLHGLKKNASSIAGGDPGSVAEPLVGMIENRLQVQASAKVAQTVSDTLGTLLDTMA